MLFVVVVVAVGLSNAVRIECLFDNEQNISTLKKLFSSSISPKISFCEVKHSNQSTSMDICCLGLRTLQPMAEKSLSTLC